jgi:hypothetical protein
MSSFEITQRNAWIDSLVTHNFAEMTLFDKDKARTTIYREEIAPSGDKTITVIITLDSGGVTKLIQVMRDGSSEPLLAGIQEALDDFSDFPCIGF